jgi:hypothetical protein
MWFLAPYAARQSVEPAGRFLCIFNESFLWLQNKNLPLQFPAIVHAHQGNEKANVIERCAKMPGNLGVLWACGSKLSKLPSASLCGLRVHPRSSGHP